MDAFEEFQRKFRQNIFPPKEMFMKLFLTFLVTCGLLTTQTDAGTPFEPTINTTKILIKRNAALQKVLNERKCDNLVKLCPVHQKEVLDPENFFFGTGTSATQTEAFDVDYIQAFFDLFGAGAGIADDFNDLFPQDLKRAHNIKNNAFRFSIEWSRVEPQEGVFDQTQIDYYVKLAKTAKERGLTPFVTINHFDYPLWIQTPFDISHGLSATNNDFIVDKFAKFVRVIVTALKKYVTYWEPINEPSVNLAFQHDFYLGTPAYTLANGEAAYRHLISMHAEAFHIIKKIYGKKKSVVIANISPSNSIPENVQDLNNINVTSWVNYISEQAFLDAWIYGIVARSVQGDFEILPKIANTVDLIDIHIYGSSVVAQNSSIPLNINFVNPPPPFPPQAGRLFLSPLNNLIRSIYLQYKKPIIIGENGYPEPYNPLDINQRHPDSDIRPQYILETLSYIQGLKIQGIPIIGYLHWSLIDNWEFGNFAERFGLFFVDRNTLKRSPKKRSIKAYKEAIHTGRITTHLISQFPYIAP